MTKLDARPPWLIRTYAGFGDAESSNARYRENLRRGQRGLSVAFDLPTQNGYDADAPMAAGEVGGTGVAVSHIGDMEVLFEGIDVGEINTSMTINATAPWLYALYVAMADQRGVSREKLRGTTQNDIFKEFVARGTHIFDPDASLRLERDLIVFAAQTTPKWNPINICGYHFMESGATPAEEVGFAMGNALLVLDAIREALDAEAFGRVVHRISFFINSGIELVPEIAKVRAYSQLWPALCEELYGVASVRWRAGCQVRSLTLTEPQPESNIVRIAYEALPVVMSASARVRALQLPGFREAISLPDQGEQTLALRTQQILMYETGLTEYGDIFEGSIVIERETSAVRDEARAIALALRAQGMRASLREVSERLTAGLVRQRARLVSGDTVRVGVNAFFDPVEVAKAPALADDTAAKAAGAARHLERLSAWRDARDPGPWQAARDALVAAARGSENVLPASIAFAKAGGTTGEWTQAIAEAAGGRYQMPLGDAGPEAGTLEVPTVPHKIHFYLAKSGLDGHINAVKLLAHACRASGMEVTYSGLQQAPDALAASAIEVDANVIGISSLSGAHLHIAKTVLRALADLGASHVPLVMGGIIPKEDHAALREMGVAAVFTPETGHVVDIVNTLVELTREDAVREAVLVEAKREGEA